LKIRSDFSTLESRTQAVSIRCPPDVVWDAASDVSMWPRLLGCVHRAVLTASGEYRLTTQQGVVLVRTMFDRDQFLLDHLVVLPVRSVHLHACRLLPNYHGTELVVSCVRRERETRADFDWRFGLLTEAVNALRLVSEGQIV
jgi:hypothetical protein